MNYRKKNYPWPSGTWSICETWVIPVLRAMLEAPEDDEPTTPEEDKIADEAWQDYVRGEARPWEEVREELGSE